MNAAELAIKQYLDSRAAEDSAFAEKYQSKCSKEEDSISKCLAYIEHEVKNLKRNIMTDAEVFGMAMHYYDEDIKFNEGHIATVKISKKEFTEEEIMQIQHEAEAAEKKRIADEHVQKMRRKEAEAEKKRKEQAERAKQEALEQAKKEAESQLSLF